jgi:hypothetical protein
MSGAPVIISDRVGKVTSPIDFWDPSAGNVDSAGDQIFYGTGPLYSENPWDLVYLNGKKVPGICSVECESIQQIDQKKPPKHDGAILTPQGFLPSPIRLSVMIWTEEQWTAFIKLFRKIWRKPLKSSSKDDAIHALADIYKISIKDAESLLIAIDVIHPSFQMHSITKVLLRRISHPKDGPVPQSKVIEIEGIQFMDPTKKTAPSKVRARSSDIPVDSDVVTPARSPSPSETACGPAGDAGQFIG